MRKFIVQVVSAISLCVYSLHAAATLVNGSTLLIEPGSTFDFGGPVDIVGVDGIKLGTTQNYDFTPGASTIDSWNFLGAAGMHYTSTPSSILSASGSTAAIDFSGWSWTFNSGFANINFGSGAWGGNADGVAELTCAVDCSDGDSYTLYYSATVSADDPNGYAGLQYSLNLTGTVSAVPLPATLWLLSSGLFVLVSASRKLRYR